MTDEDFPKLRDPSRPNVEWLRAKPNPIQQVKAPDGIIVNLASGVITKVPVGTLVIVSEDGWTGTDEV